MFGGRESCPWAGGFTTDFSIKTCRPPDPGRRFESQVLENSALGGHVTQIATSANQLLIAFSATKKSNKHLQDTERFYKLYSITARVFISCTATPPAQRLAL